MARASSLAFALGLGLAVATGHGVAAADPTGSDTPSSTSSSSESSPGSESNPASGQGSAADSADPESAPTGEVSDDEDSKQPEPDEETVEPPDTAADEDTPADAPDSQDFSEQTPAAPESVVDVAPEPDADGGSSDEGRRDGVPVDVRTTNSSQVTSARDERSGDTDTALPADAPVVVETAEETSLFVSAATPAADPSSATAAGQANLGPIGSLVSGFVALVTAPLLAPDNAPTGPVGSVLEFLYVAVRQVQRFFSNQAPTVAPVQITLSSDGSINGTVGSADVEGNELVHTVTEGPAKGTVTVFSDGSYVYTPTAEFAAAGGTDTFTVSISDATGLRFRSLGDIFTLGGVLPRLLGLPDPHATTAAVTVTVPPDLPDTVTAGTRPQAVSVTPDGNRVYVANSHANTVSVVDIATNAVVAVVDVGNHPVGLTFNPAGTRVYVVNFFGDSVSVIDTATNTVTAVIPVGSRPQGVAVSPDGLRAYVANSDGNTVSVLDTSTGALVGTIAVGADPQDAAVSPDSRRVYVPNYVDGTVSVIDAETNAVIATVAGVGSGLQDVAVSPDGARLYVTTAEGLSVIDTATNAYTNTITDVSGLESVVLSADGTRLLATSSVTDTVAVFDTSTGRAIALVRAADLPRGAQAIAVSPDGTQIYRPSFVAGALSTISVDPTASAPPDLSRSYAPKQFRVYNFSDRPITFVRYNTSKTAAVGPKTGTQIPVGGSVLFVVNSSRSGNTVMPVFQSGSVEQNDAAAYVAFLKATNASAETRCQTSGSGKCVTEGGGFLSTAPASILLLPPSGTTVKVPSGSQTQAEILNGFCVKGSKASCKLTLDSQDANAYAAGRQVGATIRNPASNPDPVVTKTIYLESISQSDSIQIGVKVSGGIDKVVNGEINATYGHTWTKTQTFSQELDLTTPPGFQTHVEAQAPIFRVTGDFRVQVFGITYELEDVYFDTPDSSRPAVFTPITSEIS